MRHALARDPLAVLVPGGVAVTVFAFALGSSSVAALNEAGKTARWAALVVLLVLAVTWARARSGPVLLASAPLAAAGLFVGLALLSSLWSVDPLLSFARAGSVALLFTVALLLAARPERAAALLVGAVAGAAAVAVGGLVLLAVAPAEAVTEATVGVPARFNGLGENANTAALLLGVATPIAVWLALARSRPLGLLLLALFAGSIAASGSRGAVAAALAGTLVVVFLAAPTRRHAAALAAVAVPVAVAVTAAGLLPDAADPAAVPPAPAAELPRYVDAAAIFPLEEDVGRPLPGGEHVERPRELLGSSGRLDAWGAALGEAAERPALGYGFGTEAQAFVDRYANFAGGLPENSYVGLLLQLGAAGLAAFAALVTLLVLAGRRALRRPVAAAAAGVVAAGLVAAIVQSYVYSVGNVATATFWISAFLLAALGAREAEARA